MRFSYQIGMCEADHYVPLAKAAEQAGYDGLTIPEHLLSPGGQLQISLQQGWQPRIPGERPVSGKPDRRGRHGDRHREDPLRHLRL